MLCLTSVGDRLMARDPDRYAAEIHARIAPMNRSSAPTQTKITRVA